MPCQRCNVIFQQEELKLERNEAVYPSISLHPNASTNAKKKKVQRQEKENPTLNAFDQLQTF